MEAVKWKKYSTLPHLTAVQLQPTSRRHDSESMCVLVLPRHHPPHGSFRTRPPHSSDPSLPGGNTWEWRRSGATLTIFSRQPPPHTPIADTLQPLCPVARSRVHSIPLSRSLINTLNRTAHAYTYSNPSQVPWKGSIIFYTELMKQ